MSAVGLLAVVGAVAVILGLLFFLWFCNCWATETVVVMDDGHREATLTEVHYHSEPTTTVL